jgi:hypothetical protein
VIVCRVIGWLLIVVVLGALGYEIHQWIVGEGSGYRFIAGGELWARASANTLVGFQALIEKQVAPWLWSDVILPILLAPAWAIPAAPGLLLVLICQRRRAHRGLR